MWQSIWEISRECNDIIGSAKGSQISEKYWGEGEKDRYLPWSKEEEGDIYFLNETSACGSSHFLHVFSRYNTQYFQFTFLPNLSQHILPSGDFAVQHNLINIKSWGFTPDFQPRDCPWTHALARVYDPITPGQISSSPLFLQSHHCNNYLQKKMVQESPSHKWRNFQFEIIIF